MLALTETLDAPFEEAFWEEERRRTFVPVRVACLLGIVAFGSYYFLDPFVTDNVRELFVARTVIILVHLGLLAFSYTRMAERHFRVLALLPCFAIGLGVVVVTQLAGGGASRYHEALLMTFLAYPLVIPTRPVSAGLSFASITIVYGAVMVATGVTGPMSTWMTNNFMLWLAVLSATAGVALGFRERCRAFEARVTIAKTSEQLANALEEAQQGKEQSEALLERITTMRHERMTWLENLAHFLRHELRNQTVAIGSSLDLTRQTDLDARAERYVERAHRSLGRMKRLVDSATEATSLEAALSVESKAEVDLSSLVRERVVMFRQAYLERRFHAYVAPSIRVAGSEDRLAQLFDKLLENAIEHTRPGGVILVDLKSTHGLASVVIENDGDALPADREGLFDAFVTVGKQNAGGQNIGLGLFVAHAIAESHGGTIEARDREGAPGACFEIRIPAEVI